LSHTDESELYKLAAELGNQLAAEIACAAQEPTTQTRTSPVKAAAEAGMQAADQAGDALTKLAADTVTAAVEQARHAADLVAWHLTQEAAIMKQAEEEAATADPASDPERAALLQAMAGGAGPSVEPMASPMLPPEAGMAEPASTLAEPAGEAAEHNEPPTELSGMDEDKALQELVMALDELGIEPQELAAALAESPEQPEGEKLASASRAFRRSGKFRHTEAKEGSAERTVRDYMKGYIKELYNRNSR
jgi:hypothetical protein